MRKILKIQEKSQKLRFNFQQYFKGSKNPRKLELNRKNPIKQNYVLEKYEKCLGAQF